MPPAVGAALAAAALTAGASAVATNVQNKAATKNNQTQQQAAVNNAQQSWTNAQQNYNAWNQANPSPIAGATIAGPRAGAYGNYSGSPLAAQVLGTALPTGVNGAGSTVGSIVPRRSQDTSPTGQLLRAFISPGSSSAPTTASAPVAPATPTAPNPVAATAPAAPSSVTRGLLSLRANPALVAQILGG